MPNSLISNQKSFKKTTKKFGNMDTSSYLYCIRVEGILQLKQKPTGDIR